MSQTLGEKLREAREERGISVSEVAEQTRISSLYITAIEKDDYKPLPGGIFNKGFVKSYAKFIGLDEHEALQDYARIVAANEGRDDDGLRKYRPEVLTDENSTASMVPTIIFAGIILALMTGGILFAVNYLQSQSETPPTTRNGSNLSNANVRPDANASTLPSTGAPTMAALKVVFTASTEDVSLSSITDGKSTADLVAAGSSVSFEPKESLRLSYHKSKTESARLSINGKQIELPQAPRESKQTIEFEINQDKLAAIWEKGRISFVEPVAIPEPPVATPEPDPTSVETAEPPPTESPDPTPRPTTTPRSTPRRRATPEPLPTRKVIVIGNANRP